MRGQTGAAGDLGGQQQVVGLGVGDGGLVQGGRVQGAPPPVRALDAVGDGDVGVQLRVALAGVPVVERGRDQAGGADPADAVMAEAGEHRLALDQLHGGGQSGR